MSSKSIHLFNPFNLQCGANHEWHAKLQEIIYYGESRFRRALIQMAESLPRHQQWMQECLHGELMYIMSHVGMAASIGIDVKVSVILRSLTDSFRMNGTDDMLPVPIDKGLMDALAAGTDIDQYGRVVDEYHHSWWTLDGCCSWKEVLNEETVEECLKVHRLALLRSPAHEDVPTLPITPIPPIQLASWPGTGVLPAIAFAPGFGPSTASAPDFKSLSRDLLDELRYVKNANAGMVETTGIQHVLTTRLAAGCFLLNQRVVLKETASLPSVNISHRPRERKTARLTRHIQEQAQAELDETESLPARKWTWGEVLTPEEVLDACCGPRGGEIHSGYAASLSEGPFHGQYSEANQVPTGTVIFSSPEVAARTAPPPTELDFPSPLARRHPAPTLMPVSHPITEAHSPPVPEHMLNNQPSRQTIAPEPGSQAPTSIGALWLQRFGTPKAAAAAISATESTLHMPTVIPNMETHAPMSVQPASGQQAAPAPLATPLIGTQWLQQFGKAKVPAVPISAAQSAELDPIIDCQAPTPASGHTIPPAPLGASSFGAQWLQRFGNPGASAAPTSPAPPSGSTAVAPGRVGAQPSGIGGQLLQQFGHASSGAVSLAPEISTQLPAGLGAVHNSLQVFGWPAPPTSAPLQAPLQAPLHSDQPPVVSNIGQLWLQTFARGNVEHSKASTDIQPNIPTMASLEDENEDGHQTPDTSDAGEEEDKGESSGTEDSVGTGDAANRSLSQPITPACITLSTATYGPEDFAFLGADLFENPGYATDDEDDPMESEYF